MAVIDDVRKITGSKADDSTIQIFVDTAQCILDSISACTSDKNISDECLEKALAYLAAHLLVSSGAGNSDTGKVKKKESFENYSVEYAMGSIEGQGIMSTTYGQSANAITQGCLQEVGKRNPSICFFG